MTKLELQGDGVVSIYIDEDGLVCIESNDGVDKSVITMSIKEFRKIKELPWF